MSVRQGILTPGGSIGGHPGPPLCSPTPNGLLLLLGAGGIESFAQDGEAQEHSAVPADVVI